MAAFFADENELVERLRWAAGLSPDERATRGERSRAHAAEHYSWDAVGRAYLTLLRGPAESASR